MSTKVPASLARTIAQDADATATKPQTSGSRGGALAGTTLGGRYDVIDLVGSGGMGEVYRALDRELDEIVALKLVRPDIAGEPALLDRFKNEVRLARRVTHRSVARTFELGEADGLRFLTMEFVEGESVASLIARKGRLDVELCRTIGIGVCDALIAAHGVGVIHRDIKPDNVLLGKGGRVVVTDFGVAKETQVGHHGTDLAGTPAYMSPEQASGTCAAAPSDLYALGVTLFEMSTGELPFVGPSAGAVLAARVTRPPPDVRSIVPELSPAFAAVVARAMARSPNDRHVSAEELRADLVALGSRSETSPLPAIDLELPSFPAEAIRTVLLLPFAAPSESSYLADALFDAVASRLARVPRLRVAARAFIESEGPASCDVSAASLVVSGERLDALLDPATEETAVEGDPEAPSTLRIAVRAALARSSEEVWTARLRIDAGRIRPIAETVARSIATAIDLDPIGADVTSSGEDPVVVDLLLRARQLYIRTTRADIRRGIALFEEALARAGGEPRALSGLAMALARGAFFGDTPDGLTRAEEATTRALEVAPELPDAQLAAGYLALHRGSPADAAGRFRRTLHLAPQWAESHEWVGRMLIELGHVPDGERRLSTAFAIDARLASLRWEIARACALEGDWAGFERWVHELAQRRLDDPRWLGRIRFAAWRRDRARLTELRARLAEIPATEVFDKAFCEAMLATYLDGRWADIGDWMDQRAVSGVPTSARRAAFVSQLVAEAAAEAGDLDTCARAFERAVSLGLFDMHWVERCPLLDRARSDARFLELRARAAATAVDVLNALYRS